MRPIRTAASGALLAVLGAAAPADVPSEFPADYVAALTLRAVGYAPNGRRITRKTELAGVFTLLADGGITIADDDPETPDRVAAWTPKSRRKLRLRTSEEWAAYLESETESSIGEMGFSVTVHVRRGRGTLRFSDDGTTVRGGTTDVAWTTVVARGVRFRFPIRMDFRVRGTAAV